MKVEIFRLEHTKQLTIGVLRLDGAMFCATLEPPWKDNQRSVSCIPTGCYYAVRTTSPRYNNTFEIIDVPQRSGILFHAGNWVGDTEGCVLLGQHAGLLRGDRAVLNSGATFKRFMEALNNSFGFNLFIVDV